MVLVYYTCSQCVLQCLKIKVDGFYSLKVMVKKKLIKGKKLKY